MDRNFKVAVRRYSLEDYMFPEVITSGIREAKKYYKNTQSRECSIFRASRILFLRDNYESLKDNGVTNDTITNVANYCAQRCAKMVMGVLRGEVQHPEAKSNDKLENIALNMANLYLSKREEEKAMNASSIKGALKQCAEEIKGAIK